MSGSTTSTGLPINSSNPLSTLNGGIGRSVTPTSGSVLFYDATGVQQNTNFLWDNANTNLYLNCNTSTGLSVIGRVNILGADSTIRNSQTFYTSADLFPQLQILPYAHNNISINFDSYWTGSQWISSTTAANGSYQINKVGGTFQINYASFAAGATVTWSTAFSLNTSGQITAPTIAASSLVTTNGSNVLVGSNTLSSTVLSNIPKITVTKLASGSGTYTAPTNCTHIKVKMWGGGGGGGGVAGNAGSGGASGGGASGGYVETIITSPTSYSYTVGAGGNGGAAGNNNGSTGGSSIFGSFQAGGGTGGIGYNSGLGAGSALGGQGTGNGGGANISFIGNPGFPGITISTTVAISGMGGNSPMGGGAGQPVHTSSSGGSGTVPGGGGAGSVSTNGTSFGGAAGFVGLIIVEEYYNG